MQEIEKFEDIQLLVRSFYSKVLKDERLAHFFAYVAQHNWNEHLERLDRFWNDIVFHTGDYQGNPMQIHKTLHHFKNLEKADFARWLELFNQTVDELFTGEIAELVKQRALSIATMMQLKILYNQD